MIRSCSVFVLAVLQFTAGKEEPTTDKVALISEPDIPDPTKFIPKRCWAPPPGINTYECCPIPMMYADEDMEACGIKKFIYDPKAPPPLPRLEECKGLCLMKKNNLLHDNETVNYERVGIYLDEWAKANPDFTEAILTAKGKCVRGGAPPRSAIKACEHDKLYFCMRANILWNCNLREEIDECQILKEHMDQCRSYYIIPIIPMEPNRIRKQTI